MRLFSVLSKLAAEPPHPCPQQQAQGYKRHYISALHYITFLTEQPTHCIFGVVNSLWVLFGFDLCQFSLEELLHVKRGGRQGCLDGCRSRSTSDYMHSLSTRLPHHRRSCLAYNYSIRSGRNDATKHRTPPLNAPSKGRGIERPQCP